MSGKLSQLFDSYSQSMTKAAAAEAEKTAAVAPAAAPATAAPATPAAPAAPAGTPRNELTSAYLTKVANELKGLVAAREVQAPKAAPAPQATQGTSLEKIAAEDARERFGLAFAAGHDACRDHIVKGILS